MYELVKVRIHYSDYSVTLFMDALFLLISYYKFSIINYIQWKRILVPRE